MSKDASLRAAKPRKTSFNFGCCGFREQHREIVSKDSAKAGTKAMRHALRIQGVMRSLEDDVTDDLATGMAVFKRKVDKDELETLLGEGKFDEAVASIPWDEMPNDLDRIQPSMESAIVAASVIALTQIPVSTASVVVGLENPRIRQFTSSQVGNLVVDISQESRRSVQRAITTSFDQGLIPRRAANIIQQSVGLTEHQTARVMTRQLREFERRDSLQQKLTLLEGQGKGASKTAKNARRDLRLLTDDRIEQRTLKFAASQQKNRAITIARTELTRATTEGQLLAWEEAFDDGVVERDQARKVWVVVPDDRLSNICADLDGQVRDMNQTFLVIQTGASVSGPPAHSNCRSALALRFEEE